MKLNFQGDLSGLHEGLRILSQELGVELSDGGTLVNVVSKSSRIGATMANGTGTIYFGQKVEFFRAFGLFVEAYRESESFDIWEESFFESNGSMIDVSRNSVLTVDSVKKWLRLMALMGLNTFMLYTEDTYEVKGQPYFGYFRGRYSFEELKECDDYAELFGIEILPCIQTLGHLAEVLKWETANKLRDTGDILLAGSEETYSFVEEMIRAASAPFRSKRIHLGMDEAYGIGLGRYKELHGCRDGIEIMKEHLERVLEITRKLGLEPMIWSDMFFKLGAGDYYDGDAELPTEILDWTPQDLNMVYWDYYHEEEDFYRQHIKSHRRFGKDPIFAGGIWTWNGLAPSIGKTFKTTNAALSACKKEGIKRVFATLWGDNGAETNTFCGILGLQLFAEHGYSKDLTMDKLKKRFKFCTGIDLEDFYDLNEIDQVFGAEGNPNPSKYLLYQDILVGIFDKQVEALPLAKHYGKLAERLARHKSKYPQWEFVFEMPVALCRVLSIKSDLGIRLKALYDKGDKEALKEIVEVELPSLYDLIDELRETHRKQWLTTNKPFGWEILDIRYGGVLARVKTAEFRLKEYLQGNIDRIEELEEERLLFGEKPGIIGFNYYGRTVSACPLG